MAIQNVPTRGYAGEISQSSGNQVAAMWYPSNGATVGSTTYTATGTVASLSEHQFTLVQTARSNGNKIETPVRYQYPRSANPTLADYLGKLAMYLTTYYDLTATATATDLVLTSTHAGITPTLKVNLSSVSLAQGSQTLAGAPNPIMAGDIVYAKPANGGERKVSRLDAGFALGRSQFGVVVNDRITPNMHTTQDQVLNVLMAGEIWVPLGGTGTLLPAATSMLLGVSGTLLGGADQAGKLLVPGTVTTGTAAVSLDLANAALTRIAPRDWNVVTGDTFRVRLSN